MSLAANRLTGVTVKVSKTRKPPIQNPLELENEYFTRCGSYTSVPKAGQTLDIKCENGGATGRYIYVYLPSKNYLTICEVQIYGDSKYMAILIPVAPFTNMV